MVTFDPPQNIGGIEGRVRGYVSELRKAGDTVVILALLPNSKYTAGSYHGAPLYTCPSGVSEAPRSVRFAQRVMLLHSIDSVFFLSGGATVFGSSLLVSCRLAGRRTAILCYGKDILEARQNPLEVALLHLSQMISRVVFSNSRYTASLLTNWGKRKARVLYPSISPDFGSQLPAQVVQQAGRVLFVGRLVRRKGLDDLIAAFAVLVPSHHNLALDIVGEGPERARLESLVKRTGLADRVTFYGALTGRPLLERYRACEIFAMTPTTTRRDVEGFGTVFLEAGWFAKPSLATDSGGVPEAVINESTGLVVQEGDVGQIRVALGRLLDEPGLGRRLGDNARARVLREFTWENTAGKLKASLEAAATQG